MGLGSFTIIVSNDNARKALGKDVPETFEGYEEVELVKYDSAGN
jgi:hypothetical protein